MARKFRFAMSRGDQKHKPVDLAALNAFEMTGDDAVVRRRAVLRECRFSEGDQVARRVLAAEQFLRRPQGRH